MKRKSLVFLCFTLVLWAVFFVNACGKADVDKANIDKNEKNGESKTPKSSYMIYYGALNPDIIETAKQYELVILHPKMGNITREQVQEIRDSGTIVLGYIAIGEDLRTAGMTTEEMLLDKRFTEDKSGPRVDPRLPEETGLLDIPLLGSESMGGSGYASYYLDDNNFDGKPDFNPIFNCAFTNVGDPSWYKVLDEMKIDGKDKTPGIREILSDDYGRGLGCDGLFLDTVDTCAPNSYTDDSSPNKTKFEWTAPGFKSFVKNLKSHYPEKLVLQNRGLFFYNPQLPHYKYAPGEEIDYVMFESYRLDSTQTVLFNENFHADNKYNYAPKLIAEAGRPNGFEILSLGYAEGPDEYELKDTLVGKSDVGLDILMEDINQTQNIAGFTHYITDGGVTLVNDFVITHEEKNDTSAPVWSSTYNDSTEWPPHEPKARIGIQEVQPVQNGMIVRWDVAFDRNNVIYTLYYQKEPFDFENDPNLDGAESMDLVPEMGEGYDNGTGSNVYPYQATVLKLEEGQEYYFIIRARDDSPGSNEEKNTTVLSGTVQ